MTLLCDAAAHVDHENSGRFAEANAFAHPDAPIVFFLAEKFFHKRLREKRLKIDRRSTILRGVAIVNNRQFVETSTRGGPALRSTLGLQIADRLAAAIRSGELPAGTRLTEKRIA